MHKVNNDDTASSHNYMKLLRLIPTKGAEDEAVLLLTSESIYTIVVE